MTRWIRNRPSRRENAVASVVAGSLGAAVGLVVYYLTRLVLAREPVEGRDREDGEVGRDRGPAA
ncbi:MAG TPA: hypothetical protein VGA70_11000 [Longimicrobiales bacterium]